MRVKLDPNDNFIEQTNHQHTHPPSRTNCEVSKVRAGIKWRAMETVLTNQQILAAQLRGISEGAVINLPVVENLLRNIRFAFQERNLSSRPINITTIAALPIDFQTKTSGNQFF